MAGVGGSELGTAAGCMVVRLWTCSLLSFHFRMRIQGKMAANVGNTQITVIGFWSELENGDTSVLSHSGCLAPVSETRLGMLALLRVWLALPQQPL